MTIDNESLTGNLGESPRARGLRKYTLRGSAGLQVIFIPLGSPPAFHIPCVLPNPLSPCVFKYLTGVCHAQIKERAGCSHQPSVPELPGSPVSLLMFLHCLSLTVSVLSSLLRTVCSTPFWEKGWEAGKLERLSI